MQNNCKQKKKKKNNKSELTLELTTSRVAEKNVLTTEP